MKEGLFDNLSYCHTIEELFKKYPNLSNPKESGVEIYKFVTSDNDGNDLLVISSMDEIPGSYSWSGFEKEEDYNVGDYLLSFPYMARTLIFDSVEDIDKHLKLNNGEFRLPGFTYR